MNNKLRESIKTAFDAPEPKRKNEFLLSVNYPKTTYMDFILAQAGYIRKRVWIATVTAVIPVLITLFANATENVLGFVWVVSSLLPFIVLTGITEIARSASHNMAEMEAGCKYGFSHVMLARLGILGFTNVILFAAIIAAFSIAGGVGILRLGMYLLVPYLLTCSLSLFALNRLRSREGVYICGAVSGFVSIVNAYISNQHRNLFSGEHIAFWGILLFILLIWTVIEINKLIKRTEAHQWNLS